VRSPSQSSPGLAARCGLTDATSLLRATTDRKEAIERHNLLLLNKLERIHEQQVPSQFDVSHHSRTVLDAPRLTNQHRRRREDERIAAENSALARRLRQAKGSFSNKQLAADAERHQYLSDQISKVQRRDKVRHKCQSLASSAALKRDAAQQQQQHVASPNNMLAVSKEDEREYVLVALQPKPQQLQRGQVEAGSPSVPLGSSPSPAPATRRLREDALPSVMPRGKAHELLAGPPTVTNTSKLISAKELLRTRHSIRTLSNA
jgi:hypothetical protein